MWTWIWLKTCSWHVLSRSTPRGPRTQCPSKWAGHRHLLGTVRQAPGPSSCPRLINIYLATWSVMMNRCSSSLNKQDWPLGFLFLVISWFVPVSCNCFKSFGSTEQACWALLSNQFILLTIAPSLETISSRRKRCSGWKWPLSLSIHQPCLYPLSLPAGGTYRFSLPTGPSALISVSGVREPVSGIVSPLPLVLDQLLGLVFPAPPSRYSMEKSSVQGGAQHNTSLGDLRLLMEVKEGRRAISLSSTQSWGKGSLAFVLMWGLSKCFF